MACHINSSNRTLTRRLTTVHIERSYQSGRYTRCSIGGDPPFEQKCALRCETRLANKWCRRYQILPIRECSFQLRDALRSGQLGNGTTNGLSRGADEDQGPERDESLLVEGQAQLEISLTCLYLLSP